MNDELFFDTTILVYAYDKSEPEKRRVCKELVKNVFERRTKGVVSNQVLGELYVILTVKKGVKAREAEIIVNSIIECDAWKKINYDAKTVKRAIEVSKKFNIHFWDAVIGETMLENSIFAICTENEKDFKKIPKIKVVNPFRS